MTHVIIIGAGFSGLAAAYKLAQHDIRVTILEQDPDIGGLARAFDINGTRLDRFYHHWFTNDTAALDLVKELGLGGDLAIRPSKTGVYFANHFFRLSTPKDLLQFTPLPFIDRIRLGLLALHARRVKDWRSLETLTAEQWIRSLGGEKVYRVVWEPLFRGKFGDVAPEISAVWFWNKLKLRGGSRGKGGKEQLAYLKGGFIRLADALAQAVKAKGSEILLNTPARRIQPSGNSWSVLTDRGEITADVVIVTCALPITAQLVESWADAAYIAMLRRIRYLANVCLVLELDRSLSSTYWLNVNDPSFPFVAVIEHTNFESAADYGGSHLVYLSKYLPETDAMFGMDENELLAFALPHIQRMFPDFKPEWIKRHWLWKARFSQPVVERNYTALIPPVQGPKPGFHLCTMAQIYPEDRGTNYAIKAGLSVAKDIIMQIKG